MTRWAEYSKIICLYARFLESKAILPALVSEEGSRLEKVSYVTENTNEKPNGWMSHCIPCSNECHITFIWIKFYSTHECADLATLITLPCHI